MGISRGNITTNIIKSGLIYSIDAANRASVSLKPNPILAYNTVDMSLSSSINDSGMWENINGGSFAFDGTGDVILTQSDLSGNINSMTGAITAQCWVKTTQTTVYKYAICRDQVGGTARDWNLIKDNFYGNGGRMIFTIFNEDSTSLAVRLTGTNDPAGNALITMNDGNWHQVTGTYNGTDTVSLYTDGVLQGNNTSAGHGAIKDSTTRVTVGGYNNGSLPTSLVGSWVGNIANTRIYNRALPANEVLHNYNALKGRFGL